MSLKSINPADGNTIETPTAHTALQMEYAIEQAHQAFPEWSTTHLDQRCRYLHEIALALRNKKEELARLCTLEMGKLYKESLAEIEKCAQGCEYYADHGAEFLAHEAIASDAGNSYIRYQAMGTILAVMPWNFPFWQVFRFAAPALLAGNTIVLKHASNVPQCALAIEQIIRSTGIPYDVFHTLLIPSSWVARVIADPRIHAITLTGSEAAGRAVAGVAAQHLKKTVLELGGSDPFVVLDDADLDLAVKNAVLSRFMNAGQSCIAAKRFILVEAIADEFIRRFKQAVEVLIPGDPMQEGTTLAPMSRHDLRDELHEQVLDALSKGAIAVAGCLPGAGNGAFYQASILDRVIPGMRAYDEELFGPVAIILRASDEIEAMQLANNTRFGLGGSIWTQDKVRGEKLAHQLQCGAAFVNGMVKSDPRLPFGGIKDSGYGRELSRYGLYEFMNIRTIWIR
ncbi:MAG: NAD-dependent succinate-semialdehyde dehydrogenase [Gammaproteobacteria bacterium]|nr:NAD-dependent succinate-semialdehyde dehydrogenase [Gammaproteobacteria bacterium]